MAYEPGATYSYRSASTLKVVTWTRDGAGVWTCDDGREMTATDADVAQAEGERFEVRPMPGPVDDAAGWGVYDTVEKRYTGGWFARHVREACELMCRLANEGEAMDRRIELRAGESVTFTRTVELFD